MSESGLSKHLRRWTNDFRTRKLGNSDSTPKPDKAQMDALAKQALESGTVPIKKLPTYKKARPDMRKRPKGY